ncbi:4-aminobutyrate aminotransferase [Salmonella bongori]|nr:4-aminobutyrate aminotransferase [Salmonella bongori]
MKSAELNHRRQQATPRGVGVMCDYFVEKAENATLWDVEGNEVIDFAAGIAVLKYRTSPSEDCGGGRAAVAGVYPYRLPDCPL